MKGIYEKCQNSSSTNQMLMDAGIEIIWDKNPKAMHHKFLVIDNTSTITESFNPSKVSGISTPLLKSLGVIWVGVC